MKLFLRPGFAALAVSFVALLWLGSSIELTEQEAYYWAWSQRLDFSYYDHPPLQAWLTAAITFLFGNGAFAVRMPAFLGHVALLYLFWTWASSRASTRTAWLSLLLLGSSAIFVAGTLIALPDVVMFPLAMLTVISAERKHGWQTGFFLGLALLAKWHAAMLVPGIVFCFVRAPSRKSLASLTIAGSIALALQAPVLWWNLRHDWPSFRYHLIERQTHIWPALPHLAHNALTFLGEQLFLGGISWAAIAGVILFAVIKRRESKPSIKAHAPPLAIWYLPTLIVFFLSHIRGESRFYWTAWALVPAALQMAEAAVGAAPRFYDRLCAICSAAVLTNTALIVIAVTVPTGAYLEPFLHRLKARSDLRQSPRGDFYGWEEWLQRMKREGHASSETTFVASDFRLAARIAWALRELPGTHTASGGRENEYQFWHHAEVSGNAEILVADNRYGIDRFRARNCKPEGGWHEDPVFLLGSRVKTIYWMRCRS